jgi:hypothetical protein
MKKIIFVAMIGAVLLVYNLTARAGITGSDPRPPKTGVTFGPGGGIPSPIGQ